MWLQAERQPHELNLVSTGRIASFTVTAAHKFLAYADFSATGVAIDNSGVFSPSGNAVGFPPPLENVVVSNSATWLST